MKQALKNKRKYRYINTDKTENEGIIEEGEH